jgi:hypothetical protein
VQRDVVVIPTKRHVSSLDTTLHLVIPAKAGIQFLFL